MELVVCSPGRKCEPSRAIFEKVPSHTRNLIIFRAFFHTGGGKMIVRQEYEPAGALIRGYEPGESKKMHLGEDRKISRSKKYIHKIFRKDDM